MARRRSPWDIPPVKMPKWDIPPVKMPKFGLMDDAFRDDERRRRREITEDVSISAIHANREAAALARAERIALERRERREAEERYSNSPEGIRQRKKEYDRQIHLRKKMLVFFWTRPSMLIKKLLKSNSEPVNYKNYISISVWIAWVIIPIVYGLILFPAVLFGSIFLICMFYFIQFEIKYFLNR